MIKKYEGGSYHLVAAADENGDGAGVGALLDDEHLLARSAEGHLLDDARGAELGRGQLLEARHDAAVGRNGDEFHLRATDPADSGQVVLQQQVVGLVVEAPLADDEVGAGVLDALDHLGEGVALVGLQLLELFNSRNVELVLGLRLRRLKGAGEDGQLGVAHLCRHLRVGEILVDDDALDEEGVLERAADLAVDLDELKVDVLALEVSNRQNSIDGDLGELVVRLGDNLAAQAGLGDLDETLLVLARKVNGVGDAVELGTGNVAGLVVAVCYADGVDAPADELGGLVEQGAGEDDDAGGAVSNLVVLGL